MMRLRKFFFGLSPEEASFARRGFRVAETGAQERLEKIGQTFIKGYNAALENDLPSQLAPRLNAIENELRGFAFEGAAMALTLLDCVSLGKGNRLRDFLTGAGKAHLYMAHVGAGWALARLHRRAQSFLARLDPLLGWLVIDGYGFHEGYFHWRRCFEDRRVPRHLSGYARRAFDQGLGRSLWFVSCADIIRISNIIYTFPKQRQPDLWSGIGLASAYAGGVSRADLENLIVAAHPFASQLAQGAAFAAKTRQRAANPAPHTELACNVLCGVSAAAAACITDLALHYVSPAVKQTDYEDWRQRIQAYLAKEPILI